MALDPVINFGKTQTSIGYDETATSIVLVSGQGASLPSSFSFNLVWWNATDYPDPSDDPNREIVRCSNRVNDTLTITRAQEGTTATTKNTANKVYRMILSATKKMIDDIQSNIDLKAPNESPVFTTQITTPSIISTGALGITPASGSDIDVNLAAGGKLDISTGNLDLDVTTHGNEYGIILKNGASFIHDFNYGNNGTVTTDGNNLFLGNNAGNLTMGSTATTATQGSYNTGLGNIALQANTTGYHNTALGTASLSANTTGYYNMAMGPFSLSNNTTGQYNSAIGVGSLYENTTGSYNTVSGHQAGYNGSVALQTNSNSVFIGSSANSSVDGLTNAIAIGYIAQATQSNQVILGNSSITQTLLSGNVGIGVAVPTASIHIKAGTATAGTAPLKLKAGTSLATPETGAIEYNGTNLFLTRSGTTRESVITANAVNTTTATAPNRTIAVVIDGATYYLHAKTTND